MSKNEPFKIFLYIWILILPWDFTKGIMGIFSIIMVIWWLFIAKRNGYFIKLKEIIYNKPLLIFFFFLFYCYASLLWSDNIEFGLSRLNFYKYYWFFIPIVFTVFNKEDVKKAFIVLISSFGIYAIFSSLIFFGLFEIKDSNSSDPKGILAYAVVTVYMALSTILTFFLYIIEKNNKKIKYLLIAIFIFSFFALVINNGRAGQIAFIGTVFILAFYYKSILLRYKKNLLLFIIVFSLTIIGLYSFNKLDRHIIGVKELFVLKESHFDGNFGARAYMWYAAADGISNHFFFGAGVGDTIDEFIEYGNKNPSKATHLRSYHNQHLDYLTKYGVVGYILFLSSIFVLLRCLYKENRDFFVLGLAFFSIVLIDSLGDIILLMKPFNNIYALVFVLFAIMINKKEVKVA